MDYRTSLGNSLRATLRIPGDKSISHRSIILGSLADGETTIQGLLESEDCLNTINAFQMMGVNIQRLAPGRYRIKGVGLRGLKEPDQVLDCGNSGTTMRLLTGLLAAQNYYSVLTGDQSLRTRPMDRVIFPLRKMGASIWGRQDKFAPLSIKGAPLKGMKYILPVASAQVKSAILLAGLYATGDVEIEEPGFSRDHTERMLKSFGIELITRDKKIILRNKGQHRLQSQEIDIPGDISSAAFLIAGALITENSEIILENIGINPTRSGFLTILKNMNAHIEILNERSISGEPVADIRVKSSSLENTEIRGDIIPTLIDEIPIIAVLATQAEGKTVIRDAGELRVKESDRIKTIVENLSRMGADIEPLPDGMIISGPTPLKGGVVLDSYNDHRVAMSLIVAGMVAEGPNKIKNIESVNTSFPGFGDLLRKCLNK
jgi:3-phosphoshikimate 1-carboxyvinyltransferase